MKVVNGTYYHDETPDKLIEELENARINNLRVKFVYGKDGKRWWETYDVCGFIGRSMGPQKIPIILYRRNSVGGGTILDDCIIQLFVGNSQRYVNESMRTILCNYGYEISKNGDKFELNVNNGEWISNHKTHLSASRMKDFLIGERMAL